MKHRLPIVYKGHHFDVEKGGSAFYFTSPEWRGMLVTSRTLRAGVKKLPHAIDEFLEFMSIGSVKYE